MIAVVSTGSGISVTWIVAHHTAHKRGLRIGTMPALVAAFGALTAGFGASLAGWTIESSVVVAVVTVAAVVDARTGLIFDPLTIGFALLTFGLACTDGRLDDAVMGSGALGGSLLLLYVMTLRRGIGLGDVKLATGMGAGLGLERGSMALGAAFIVGGVVGAWLLATRPAAAGSELRFGPFLALGTYAAVFVSVLWR